MNDKLDFSIVRTAGVPVAHFARLVGGSRVSANSWVNGSREPRGLYRTRAIEVLLQIRKAYAQGKLPLPRQARDNKFDALIAVLS